MRIAVVGTGYVGLVSGVCLASLGHDVIGIDSDTNKVAALQDGDPQIFEEGLEDLLRETLASGRIAFSSAIDDVSDTELVLIAVGTPQRDSGKTDLSAVFTVARDVAPHLPRNAVVVIKSTVPVETGDTLRTILDNAGRPDLRTASNPEFLRQGRAVHDFLNPDRIVVGADDDDTHTIVTSIYESMESAGVPIIQTSIKTAELIKYAANALLATKLAYVNEMADLCEAVGASIDDVTKAVGLDERISPSYMTAGPGFGGSCLPKDTQALLHAFTDSGQYSHIVRAAVEANQRRRAGLADRVIAAIGYQPKRVAVWGLTFKAYTDDLRDSPSVDLVRGLAQHGIHISVFDPLVREIPDDIGAHLAASPLASAADADGIVIATDWREFAEVDMDAIAEAMAGTAVVDFRDLLDSEVVNRAGLDHFPIGRPSSPASSVNRSLR